MYTPIHGGSFGQHAWNEIYMGGKAGWIPVDSTAGEIDYVDSGHIRFGELVSFNPVKMEVLDYRAGGVAMGEEKTGLAAGAAVPWKTGETYRFAYSYNGAPIGFETFTIEAVEETAEGKVYAGAGGIELTGLKASCEWRIREDGTPLSYRIEAQSMEYSREPACASIR